MTLRCRFARLEVKKKMNLPPLGVKFSHLLTTKSLCASHLDIVLNYLSIKSTSPVRRISEHMCKLLEFNSHVKLALDLISQNVRTAFNIIYTG